MPGLNNLPTEVLGLIRDQFLFTEQHNLGSLRLTCKEIHAKSHNHFVRAYFSTVKVDIRPDGFDRLFKICQYDDYRLSVRKLSLLTELFTFAEDDEQPEEEQALELDTNALEYANSDSFADQLYECVKSLSNLRCVYIEHPYTWGEWIDVKMEWLKITWYSIVVTTLSVVRDTQLFLEELEISKSSSFYFAPNLWVLSPLSGSCELTKSMTKLTLCLNTKGVGFSSTALSPFTEMIDNARSLSSLDLSFNHGTGSADTLAAISPSLPLMSKLKKLSLSQMTLSSKTLVTLLRNLSIESVNLSDIAINIGAWVDVFTQLKSLQQLQKVHLLFIREKGYIISFKKTIWRRPFIDHCWTWEGTPPCSEEEKAFLDTFQLVVVGAGGYCITLDRGEGDDIVSWLSLIASEYTLKRCLTW